MNMFATIHHTPHSQKKRTIANVYSKSYIASSPQVAANSIALLTTRFLPLFDELSKTGEAFDAHDLNNAMAMDFVSLVVSYIFQSRLGVDDIAPHVLPLATPLQESPSASHEEGAIEILLTWF